jgi:hypothetical protein
MHTPEDTHAHSERVKQGERKRREHTHNTSKQCIKKSGGDLILFVKQTHTCASIRPCTCWVVDFS